MAAALTLTAFGPGTCDVTEKVKIFRGTVALTGSYTASGDTLSLVACAGVGKVPIQVTLQSKNGYGIFYVPGTTIANGLLYITTASATELAATTYPAGLTGDTITIQAYFLKE